MASHHRSGSRHRSPSPGGSSSKRQRHSYRDRSRSRDRHRSSSHRHHRSSRYEDSRHDDSRYDDRAYHSSSSSSRRHYDNVSVNDKRTSSREPTSRKDAVGNSSAMPSIDTHAVSLHSLSNYPDLLNCLFRNTLPARLTTHLLHPIQRHPPLLLPLLQMLRRHCEKSKNGSVNGRRPSD